MGLSLSEGSSSKSPFPSSSEAAPTNTLASDLRRGPGTVGLSHESHAFPQGKEKRRLGETAFQALTALQSNTGLAAPVGGGKEGDCGEGGWGTKGVPRASKGQKIASDSLEMEL